MEIPQTDTYSPVWRIDLLGRVRARSNNHDLTRFQTQKTALLLAYLACHTQRRHSREELVDMLWPEAEPDAGRNRLSQALGWLRTHLEPAGTLRGSILLADRYHVGLHPDAVTTDVAAFEAALRVADMRKEPEQIDALLHAVDIYEGEFLPGYYDDWVLKERQRLSSVLLTALRSLVMHYEHREEWASALTYARRALSADSLDEEWNRNVIRLLAASGQPSTALHHFRDWERALAKELGETPSDAAYALADRIRRTTALASASATVSPMPLSIRRTALRKSAIPPLPLPITRFFGRDAEVAHVQALIQSEDVRLVTLTGLGGVGKTRLALEIASHLAAVFEGAVWFVPLADLSDARHILAALADQLRLSRSGTESLLDQILDQLSLGPSLLVLDNMEHLMAGGPALVRDIMARVPTLTVLITSRQRLGLEGEREIPVPPLSTPAVTLLPNTPPIAPESLIQSDSVRLFVDRAQAVRPSFAVTAQNAGVIVRLCECLEGLPLALELCAAWAQTLTPAQMLTQLARRFDLLVSRRADIAPRHRTLRAALEYSYLLLPPDLQQLLVRLSVFRGGWTLEAAQQVCLEQTDPSAAIPLRMLSALTELRERSLIVAAEAEGDAMRYRLLETVREFAGEQQTLAVAAPLRQRHLEYFLQLAEASALHITGAEHVEWLGRLEAEHDNMRAVLGWTLEVGAPLTGLPLAIALTPFWDMRGYPGEGQDWLKRLLALSIGEQADSAALAVRAQALNASAHLARARAQFADATASATEALQLWRTLGAAKGVATSLQLLATLAYSREDYDGARTFAEEALHLAQEADDRPQIASALLNLGNIALEQHRWSDAWTLFSESLKRHRTEGNPKRIADALNNLGLVARYQGNLATARSLLEESLVICRELVDRSGTAITLLNLGTVDRLEGRFPAARTALHEAATLAIEVDNKRALAWCVRDLGHLACAEGDYVAGVRLLSAAETLRLALGMSFNPADPEDLMRSMARIRAALGESEFAAAWTPDSELSLAEAYSRAVMRLQEP